MIRVFGPTDKDFSSNGDVVIQPLKAVVHKEDNGDYYLNLQAGTNYAPYLADGNVIVADTPQGAQAFRVASVTKTRTKITAKAWHVFYDAKNYLIADSYVVDMNCNAALDHLNQATEPRSEFTTISDVQTIDSYRCVRKSLYEAVQTVLTRWGGHLVRDNFNIGIRDDIGVDNGVVVRYGKNLQNITCEENWDSVVTKILPVGKDGILLNDQDASASIYIDGPKHYDIPYTKTVTFSQTDIKEDDFADEGAYHKALVDDLRTQARNYVTLHCVPQVNYTLKADLEKVTDIGDIVQVVDERLGLDLTTSVISYDYDCIQRRYTTLEFGNFRKTLNGFAGSVATDAQKTATSVVGESMQGVTNTVTNNIISSMGASYVTYDGSRIMVLDALPKEEARNVILINNNGIAFSRNGINGPFSSAWAIDGTLNMQSANVINLVADMVKGGTLKLGSALNQSGKIELYNAANRLTCTLDNNGLIMYATDGGYVVLNQDVGFVCYDSLGNPIYWASNGVFHMAKAVVEEEITLSNSLRFIPITMTDNDGNVTSDGIGLVADYSRNEVII